MYFLKCVLGGALLTLAPAVKAAYKLEDDINPSNFFDHFNFYTGADPTNGFVDYISGGSAESLGLMKPNEGYLGVDSKTLLTSNNGPDASTNLRKSTRIYSKKSWANGLFIADIAHMPPSTCGIWAAYWMLGTGQEWPAAGEIDIIEGVNTNRSTTHTLHTAPGCSFAKQGNCDANIDGNKGCQSFVNNPHTYGTGFNSIGGGVYATELTSNAIKIWFFPRGQIPSELQMGSGDNDNNNGNNNNNNNNNHHSRRSHPRDVVIGTSGGDRNLHNLIGYNTPPTTTSKGSYTSSPEPSHKAPPSGGSGGGAIDPSTWGTPAATFQGGTNCDIPSFFGPQQLIFNTALCGDWAGKVFDGVAECKNLPGTNCDSWQNKWESKAACQRVPDTCSKYVAANPEAFKDAYWKINGIRVYQH